MNDDAFGITEYEGTGNLAMVRKVMGHTDVRTAMRYQHPILHPAREIINPGGEVELLGDWTGKTGAA